MGFPIKVHGVFRTGLAEQARSVRRFLFWTSVSRKVSLSLAPDAGARNKDPVFSRLAKRCLG
jgi:hypothetical protein